MIKTKDNELYDIIHQEKYRQESGINLIASENYVSKQVMQISGSVLTNKYVEGYPGKRYYSGCSWYDQIELLAIDRFKQLFKAEHVNVQPHSGSQANAAVYLALLKPGDTILSMDLSAGGHLSHGHKVNWTHQLYTIVSYGVDPISYTLDYNVIEQIALQCKPKLIIAGASAYSRMIDFRKFADIAAKVGALFMADIAHLAGLVVAGLHQSPFPYADIVTMTTHKTFRGPHGGVIMSKQQLGVMIDKMLMPGMQGGALMNHVAGKAAAAFEAMEDIFLEYQQQVIKNATTMAQLFMNLDYKVITGGTDNHLFLIDVMPLGLNGRQVEELLESVGIFVNRNAIPFDVQPPLHPSGIRIGTPALTTLGADEDDIEKVVYYIDHVIKQRNHPEALAYIRQEVINFMDALQKRNKKASC